MVMDFGVAKAVSMAGGETLTTVGVAVGTPHYMSPEQATGAEHLDHRSDIYSIGILAYELLTGETPFKGKTAQAVLSAQVLEKPRAVTEIRSAVPGPLAELVKRCLEKQPADRWQSAEEILRELEAIATPSGGITPTTTRPVKVTDAKLASPAVSRRTMLVGVAAAAVAIAAYGGWRVLGARTPGPDHMAVMPIQDLSGADQVFVDAMHDQLIVALGQVPGASVSPRSAVMQYRSEPRPMREVAAELGVGAILESTVFRAGDRMRITVQLVEPQTIRQIWSNSYEIDVRDDFAAQDSVVRQIASGIQGAVITPTGTSR
jgi:TolB-like protein